MPQGEAPSWRKELLKYYNKSGNNKSIVNPKTEKRFPLTLTLSPPKGEGKENKQYWSDPNDKSI